MARKNRLKLNTTKTELIILGTHQQTAKAQIETVNLGGAEIRPSTAVKNLGVIIDQNLTMTNHISKLVSSSFNQLRQVRAVADSLAMESKKTLMQALITSRVDYCNSLLAHITRKQLKRLQAVQNAAARLVTGTTKWQHITPVLRSLHWLPVESRISFKVASLVEKCLRGEAPKYLTSDCELLSKLERPFELRSDQSRKLQMQRTRNRMGDRSFRALGPAEWNALPTEIRDKPIERAAFLKQLKTYFFMLIPS